MKIKVIPCLFNYFSTQWHLRIGFDEKKATGPTPKIFPGVYQAEVLIIAEGKI